MQQNRVPKDAGTQTTCGKVVDDKKMVSGMQISHDTLRGRKVYKPRLLKCNIPLNQLQLQQFPRLLSDLCGSVPPA